MLAAPHVNAAPFPLIALNMQDGPVTSAPVPFDVSGTGYLFETRVAIDLTLAREVDPSGMQVVLRAPKATRTGNARYDEVRISAQEFKLEGSRLFGTTTTSDLNGIVFNDGSGISPGWQLQILDDAGTPQTWGVGDLHTSVRMLPLPLGPDGLYLKAQWMDLGSDWTDLRGEWMDLRAEWMDLQGDSTNLPEPASAVMVLAGVLLIRRGLRSR
jgi:hypothetical protein